MTWITRLARAGRSADRAWDCTLATHRQLTTQTETVPPHPPGPTQPPASDPDRPPVIHRWPPDNTGRFGLPLDVDALTPCCRRPAGDLPGDRFSTNPRIITCHGAR